MASDNFVQIDLDINEIRAVHTGGMMMDDESPSYDVYKDPYIIMKDGTHKNVSKETAMRVSTLLNARRDDGFGDFPSG